MGLAASQARILLLTARNDALELSAQMIEQERLMLAQEQETIAQKYSDATSNEVYINTYLEGKNNNEKTTTCLTPAGISRGEGGKIIGIQNESGEVLFYCKSVQVEKTRKNENGEDEKVLEWVDTYYKTNGEKIKEENVDKEVPSTFRNNSYNNPLQQAMRSGAYNVVVFQPEADSGTDAVKNSDDVKDNLGITTNGAFVAKSLESLSGTSSRYYTEDDQAAQAEYQAAMARVNRIDTKLENKLNQVETQKKAVESEMESAKQLVQKNIERTFKYFS